MLGRDTSRLSDLICSSSLVDRVLVAVILIDLGIEIFPRVVHEEVAARIAHASVVDGVVVGDGVEEINRLSFLPVHPRSAVYSHKTRFLFLLSKTTSSAFLPFTEETAQSTIRSACYGVIALKSTTTIIGRGVHRIGQASLHITDACDCGGDGGIETGNIICVAISVKVLIKRELAPHVVGSHDGVEKVGNKDEGEDDFHG